MADDLFTSRVKAFTGLLRSAAEFEKPSELELYEQKAIISSDIRMGENEANSAIAMKEYKAKSLFDSRQDRLNRPGDLDFEKEKLKLKDEFKIKEEDRKTAADEAKEGRDDKRLKTLADNELNPEYLIKKMYADNLLARYKTGFAAEDTKVSSAQALRSAKGTFDKRGGQWIGLREDMQPGMTLGSFGIKRFDPELLTNLLEDRVGTVGLELGLLQSQEGTVGFQGMSNPRRAALKEEVDILMSTVVNNPYITKKMRKKGNTQEKVTYQNYVASIMSAYNYLKSTEDKIGRRVSTQSDTY